MTDDQLGEVLRTLSARGFKPIAGRRGRRSFRGSLPCRGESVAIELHIEDWDFIDYPAIKVISGVSSKAQLPHVNPNGWLCYFEEGSVVLDRYAPAASVLQCLIQAQRVLESIKFDPLYRTGDIQDEFLIHWLNGQSTRIENVLLGSVSKGAKSINYWTGVSDGNVFVLLSDREEEIAGVAKALRAERAKMTSCPCWLCETEKLPAVPDKMPATIKELFTWLKDWDIAIYNWMQRVLGTEKSYLRFGMATFAVKTPIGWLGFGFDLNQITRLGAKDKPKLYRQHLHGRGGSRGILRLALTEIGPAYVHSRNLTHASLMDRHVTVVGCGAIGSFVAQSLARLGAGAGKGNITLIDPETLQPDNLGRHALGYPSLFHFKAEALRDEIQRLFPFAQVSAIPKTVQSVNNLFNTDLIIDAAGEEAVSEMLNARRLESRSKTPVLHTWILGNGDSVQSLWTEGTQAGCYRCLTRQLPDGGRVPRYPVLKAMPVRRHLGCRAFSPYAVSAPMHAASLATEVIVDWLRTDSPSPKFRTRSGENANVLKVKNQDPSALNDCPACARFHAA